MAGEILAGLIAIAVALGLIGDAYEATCESVWGGTYVNDNPNLYQGWSCVGGTPPGRP